MPTLAELFKKALTREKAEELEVDGFTVLDADAFPKEFSLQLLSEVKKCFDEVEGGKTPNQVEFLTSDGAVKLTKPHIYECDLFDDKIRRQLPLFDDFFNSQLGELAEVLRDRVPSCEDIVDFCGPAATARSLTLKLQMNDGGAFPWHFDNPTRPNKRRLTMAVYLTEDWTEAVGGEVQLMPFLGECVTVPPRLGTVVLFRSDMTLHRVRPVATAAGVTRYCFTVWFDGLMTNTDADQFLTEAHLREEAIPLLRRSPVHRALARAVYEREFRAALGDCFGTDTAAYKISLHEHEVRLAQLMRNAKVASFVEILISHRQDSLGDSQR